MKNCDVCIVGGGAAGLAAAASLDDRIKVCIVEKNKIPGRKLAATGGGRCNITNEACAGKDDVLDFFRALGLETYMDSQGRYFPYSNQASDVVKTLTDAARSRGTDILTEFAVTGLVSKGDRFLVSGTEQTIRAKTVVLASGGKAAPHLGTTGDGYALASKLGHSIEKLYPVLTGIECGDFRDIKGTRARGKAGLYRDGRLLRQEQGEIQFTRDGISGICIFNLTLEIRAGQGQSLEEALSHYSIHLDLAPDFTEAQLRERQHSFGILSARLAEKVGIGQIKDWRLPVMGVKGWKNAQCTAGGIALPEIDGKTMESKLVPGLYFAGEIIDYQGPCGGFNLQNAWETAIKAAETINERMP